MSKNSEQDAHNKGEQDEVKSSGRNSTAEIITDQLFGGPYRAPSGHEDSYDKGRVNSQNQKK